MKTLLWTMMGAALVAAGCAAENEAEIGRDEASIDGSEASRDDRARHGLDGKKLFEKETFGGNGRTCATCHNAFSGTISPSQVQALFNNNPNAPLFRPIDSDDGVGTNYSKLKNDATIRVSIDLPPGWKLVGDPSATQAVFRRGIPTTFNVPALDPILMVDGRNNGPREQALGAINAHYQPGRQPSGPELDAIVAHEKTKGFFSDKKLESFANGGPAPTLPAGKTAAEKRGRPFFEAAGLCGACHNGAMLNTTSDAVPPFPAGLRFVSVLVSEFNRIGQPLQKFEVTLPDGSKTEVESSDPGRALITGDLADFNAFRIPTLWGVKNTAPYFHDNSAKSLADVVAHYSDFFVAAGFLPAPLTQQQRDDIIAYMRLLLGPKRRARGGAAGLVRPPGSPPTLPSPAGFAPAPHPRAGFAPRASPRSEAPALAGSRQ